MRSVAGFLDERGMRVSIFDIWSAEVFGPLIGAGRAIADGMMHFDMESSKV